MALVRKEVVLQYKSVLMKRQRLLFYYKNFSIDELDPILLHEEKIKLGNEYLVIMHYKFLFFH